MAISRELVVAVANASASRNKASDQAGRTRIEYHQHWVRFDKSVLDPGGSLTRVHVVNESFADNYARYFATLRKSSRIETRGGRILLVRRGALNAMDQTVGRYANRAPERRGFWAFPWPHFDDFFAHHKFDEVVPKHLTRGAIEAAYEVTGDVAKLWEEREVWIRANRKTQPLRKFWWEGDIWARFNEHGDVDPSGWFLLPVQTFAATARKLEPDQAGGVDHLEVFCAPTRGHAVGRAD